MNSFADTANGVCGVNGVGNSGCTLRSALIAANALPGADTVTLPVGTYTLTRANNSLLDATEGDLNIDESITIIGNATNPAATIINANSIDRVFNVEPVGPAPVTAILNGLTVRGGTETTGVGGGAILASSETLLDLRNSVITANRAQAGPSGAGSGGAILTQGDLNLTTSTISNNTSTEAGGGIAMRLDGALTVVDSTISNNTAASQGGGLYAGDGFNYQVSLTNSILADNTSTNGEGGGLYINGGSTAASVTFDRVQFLRNTAGLEGAGAYVTTVSTFTQTSGTYSTNNAGGAGGGLYLLNNGNQSTIDGTTFSNNSSVDGGGGATVLDDAIFRNTLFENNRVTGSITDPNRFDLGGGGLAIASPTAAINGANVRIEDSSFLTNTAPLGGGIGAANANLTVIGSTIQGNRAVSTLAGAGAIGIAQDDASGVAANRTRLTIQASIINGNTATQSSAGGVGIADVDAVITDTTLTGNTAMSRAGGIGIIGLNNDPVLTLNRVTIDNNTAGQDGGGLAAENSRYDLANTTISNNSATTGGGLSFASEDPLLTGSIQFSTIASNTADFGSNVAVTGSVTRLLSSIVADPLGTAPSFNFVSGGPGQLSSQGFNIFSDTSISGTLASDFVNTNPLLSPLANNGGVLRTRALQAASPAIDAGAASPLSRDARNLTRPVDGNNDTVARNDIGAFEIQVASTLNLGNLVFLDVDNNGLFDPAEDRGIGNASLELFRDANGNGSYDANDVLVASTLTSTAGAYAFNGLAAGDYIVRFDPDNFSVGGALYGLNASGPAAADPDNNIDNDNNGVVLGGAATAQGVASRAITLAANTEPSGNINLTLDFGFSIIGFSTVKGVKFNDLNLDGDDENGTEPRLRDVGIILTGDAFNTGELTTIMDVTDDTGLYRFDGVPSGNYTVTEAPINITSMNVSGTNSPVAFNEAAEFDGKVSAVANDQVVISERVVRASSRSQFIEVTFTRRNQGPLVANTAANWFANYTLTTDVPVSISGANSSYFYFSVAGAPLPIGTNGFVHPFDSTVPSVGRLNVNLPAATTQNLGISSNPFTTIFNNYNIPTTNISNVSAVTIGYLLTTTRSRATTSPVPVNVVLADSETVVDPSNDTGGGERVIPHLAIGNDLGNVIAVSDAVSTNLGTPITINPLANDTTTTGTLRLVAIATPSNGTATIVGNQVRFAPNAGFVGVTQFSYQVTNAAVGNANGQNAFATITVNVDASNQPPVAANDTVTLPSPTAFAIPIATLLANDNAGPANESQSLSITAVTQPAQGRVVRNSSDITFTPPIGFSGSTSFTYTVADDGGATDIATVTIIVPAAATPLSGRITCDLNGNGTIEANEGMPGVTVFVDNDGDRLRDSDERFAVTDSTGTYRFTGANFAAGQKANLIVQNPPSCVPVAPEFGVTRRPLNTGLLSRALVATDFDRDGDNDLLVVNELGNDVSVLLNNASNVSFTLSTPIQIGQRGVGIDAWQATSSSSPVIAVAAIGTVADKGGIHVIENGRVTRKLSAGNGPVSVAVEDFNGDGQADFVAAASRSGSIVARISGQPTERVLAIARNPRSVTTARINNDAFVDLVVVAFGFEGDVESQVIVLLGDGRGNFTVQSQPITGRGAADVAVGNFDSDAADELVVASYDGSVKIIDFASGRFTTLTTLQTEIGIEAVAAGDLNRDGRSDLVIGNSKAETIELFVNSSNGFVRNRTIKGVPSPSDLVIAPLDRDNIVDLAVTNLYGQTSPTFRLPSSVTLLGLTITERELTFTASPTVANFVLAPTVEALAQATAISNERFDVDRNGKISVLDALRVLNRIARARAAGESKNKIKLEGDVNGDGVVTIIDALLILNKISRDRRV